MLYKCCFASFRENYDSECKVKIFRLPHKRWLKEISRGNTSDAPNTFICEDHRPKGYKTKCVYRKLRLLESSFSVYRLCQTKFSSNTDQQHEHTLQHEMHNQMIELPHIKN